LDEEVRRLAENYQKSVLPLIEYVERRAAIEQEKGRRVLRNLMEMRIRK